MNGLSGRSLGKVFGNGWFEGVRCTTGVPLSVVYSLLGAALREQSLAH
jgi:hypothetical protein